MAHIGVNSLPMKRVQRVAKDPAGSDEGMFPTTLPIMSVTPFADIVMGGEDIPRRDVALPPGRSRLSLLFSPDGLHP